LTATVLVSPVPLTKFVSELEFEPEEVEHPARARADATARAAIRVRAELRRSGRERM
jgi:hypothetical protein